VIAMTAPVEFYRDPAIFAAERTAIFARSWQFLGLESDLARPGDFLAETIAGYPLMAVRDEAGALRAYHNVCPHRAGPLVGEARGRCGREIVCRYHGWRYGFDGRLQAAEHFDEGGGLDLGAYSLFPARVETWRGFVFVNVDLEAAPLSETLRPLDARLGNRASLSARVRDSHTVACNWKVYVENCLEGYHLEGVHPGLAADVHAGRHDVRIDGDVAMHDLPADFDGSEGLWAWVWPNLGLTLNQGVLRIEHMRPQGPDSTLLQHLYLHEPEDPSVDAAHLSSEQMTDEDAWICERVQQNLDAGVFRSGPLSPSHEGALAWFQARVTSLIG
jgi:choline monooxygenase